MRRHEGTGRGGVKRGKWKRNWTFARRKVEEEGGCRYYRSDLGCAGPIEAAHVIGRAHDDHETLTEIANHIERVSATVLVHPDRIVPLCRVHHDRYDGRDPNRIDILHVLSLDEQLQAVRDAGGIALALRRISGRPDPKREAA